MLLCNPRNLGATSTWPSNAPRFPWKPDSAGDSHSAGRRRHVQVERPCCSRDLVLRDGVATAHDLELRSNGRRKFCSLLAEALPGRCECYIPGDIQDQHDAAGVFQPMIFQDTGARFLRRASQRNFRLADLEVYVFHRKVHGIDRA